MVQPALLGGNGSCLVILAIQTALSLRLVIFADQVASIFADLISGGLVDHLVEGILIALLGLVATVDTLLVHALELVVEWFVFTIRNHIYIELQPSELRLPVRLVLGLYLLVRPADKAHQLLPFMLGGLFREEAVVLFLIFENVPFLLQLLTLWLQEIVVHLFNVVRVLLLPWGYLVLTA